MIVLIRIISSIYDPNAIRHPPLGLLYISGALKKNGYQVKIFQISEKEIEKTINTIKKLKPAIIGFSVLTGYPTLYSDKMTNLLKKELADTVIVWGGHHPTHMYEQCMGNKNIDYIVCGEGEISFLELVNYIKKTGNPHLEDIRGIVYRKNNKLIKNPDRDFIKNIDDFEPDFSSIDIEKYIIKNRGDRIISFYSSRGCPFDCNFCSIPRFYKRCWRTHSVEFIVNFFRKVKRDYNINGVFFSDDEFFINKNRAKEILMKLYNEGIYAKTLCIRIPDIDEKLIQFLDELKVTGLFIGIESGNDRVLKEVINKGFNKEKIYEKMNILKKYSQIEIWLSYIIGFPTETEQEMQDTVDLAIELSRYGSHVATSINMWVPLPGTFLYDKLTESDIDLPGKNNEWVKVDVCNPNFNPIWIKEKNKFKKNFFMILKYTRTFFIPRSSENKIIYFIKLIFYKIAVFRIKRIFFQFPVEYKIFNWLKSIKYNIKNKI